MDKNNLIGFLLLSVLFLLYLKFNPMDEKPVETTEADKTEVTNTQVTEPEAAITPVTEVVMPDSIINQQLALKYGDFSTAISGTGTVVSVKNEKFRLDVNTKGGRINAVELFDYKKEQFDSADVESVMNPLMLLNDTLNSLNINLPVNGVLNDNLKTSDLIFVPQIQGNTVTMTATGQNGAFVKQIYTINDDYTIDYQIKANSARGFKSKNSSFEWTNYLEKIERSVQYEKMYSTIAYKENDENPTTLSYTSEDEENLENKVDWVAHSNQFFSSAIMRDGAFENVNVSVANLEEDDINLKIMNTSFDIPTDALASGYNMKWYVGPNKFENLKAFDTGMENIIPFGWSVFGTINRWVVRPIFNFLSGLVGNAGIAILLLTFFVKLLVFPLMYKMLYSQSKMQALKPKIEAMKKKLGDDKQAVSVETMKLYREYGASPFGGCLPQLLQLPLWFALYRFFPASIDFRQQGFLWATDLSTYDVFAHLPFEIPFYGSHVSMFTILWAIGTLIFSYYNSKHMDFTANPSMKYMQYMMPVMFLFFFNSYASGLTLYLFFGVLFNILQTYVTKNILIDQEKVKLELEEYKTKPKKKGGFAAKLEEAMNQQKAIQEEKNKKNKKK